MGQQNRLKSLISWKKVWSGTLINIVFLRAECVCVRKREKGQALSEEEHYHTIEEKVNSFALTRKKRVITNNR